ncbi:MAG: S41 family peptidase [Sedimentisphaerales bacterium]|nr:S41 family peptidase [Sedimentisphaerales bacterium]
MKRAVIPILVLFFTAWPAFAMSSRPRVFSVPKPTPVKQISDNAASVLVKNVVQEICRGKFDAAENILSRTNSTDAKIAALADIVSQYKQIDLDREKTRQQKLVEQLAEIEQLKTRYEVNEPNLSEAFPVIIRAHEFADDTQKEQILADEFVQRVFTTARQKAGEFEAKGQWLDSLIYCYSWLSIIYKDDKAILAKKEELEDKALMQASLVENPCETGAEHNPEKIKAEMFIRSLDVLEYGYVEPFYYSSMTEEVFKQYRYLADILYRYDANGSDLTVTFLKDKIPDFVAGLDSLKKEYNSELPGLSRDQFVKLFNQVLELNSSTIQLPKQTMISHFAGASLGALDPHTTLVWPKEKEEFDKSLTNEFTGIGVEISKADGFLRAVSLLPGTPAYNSGMDIDDIIEEINGEKTRDMPITCAVSKITGPAGTKVVLTIRRANEEKPREFEITRAKIVVPTTRGWLRDASNNWLYFVDDRDKVGYVRVTNFSASTAADVDKIINDLERQGLKALILDLRFNTGGYLQSAADISDMFIKKGIIVSMQPRVGLPSWEAAHLKGTRPDYPLVVMINSSSASAAEIVAGALSDKTYSRATLVGEQSYGKGSVQTVTSYPGDGSQLKYTMAYYHLPDGSKVKSRYAMEKLGRTDWGIMPDVKIELRSDESKEMLDVQRDNEVLASAVHDDTKTKLARHGLEEILEADRQLAVAILVAKAKLIGAEN